MKMKALTACAAVVALAGATQARPVDLALWTFETSAPVTAGPHAAEGGVFGGNAYGNGGNVYSSPAGNGSSKSFSSNGWDVNDNYEFRSQSTGYNSLTVTWDQTSSNTGPRDFKLQMSINGGGAWTDVLSYQVLANGTPNAAWSSGTNVPAYGFSASLGVTADNLADIRVRMIQTSTVSANGGTVAGTGTDRVDNVKISGDLVPTPGSLALLGLGGLVAARRRRA